MSKASFEFVSQRRWRVRWFSFAFDVFVTHDKKKGSSGCTLIIHFHWMFPPKILNRKWFVVLTVYCIEGFKWLLPLLSTESLQRCFCFLVLCDSKWSFDYSYVAKKKKKKWLQCGRCQNWETVSRQWMF